MSGVELQRAPAWVLCTSAVLTGPPSTSLTWRSKQPRSSGRPAGEENASHTGRCGPSSGGATRPGDTPACPPLDGEHGHVRRAALVAHHVASHQAGESASAASIITRDTTA